MSVMQKIQRIKRAVAYVGLLTKHYLLKPIARMLYGGKHIWIASERGTDARDNGFHLYRYIRENHPEQRIYYIIDKKSPDYPKVAAIGDVVERYSLMHWLLYLGADVKISTHNNGLVPANNWRYRAFISHTKSNDKIVFLQHGVIKDDMKGLYKENTNIRLFICGAKPEYDYILSRYGYSEDELKYTGLARFDELHHFNTKRQVLIMPTWREWLSSAFRGGRITIQDVENSPYVQEWSAFLRNDRIRELAQRYRISFIFYPHYEMQPFLNLFQQDNEQVVLADFAHYDVQ